MIVSEIIRKKREGLALSFDELEFLVQGFSDSSIPDYQVSAWLMASFLCGLDRGETFSLTRLMKDSGKHFDWRSLSSQFTNAKFADKHSTGGVGDKVSLILAPLAVCLDLKVPMMSGRGLGHTGGTVDKLESIPGFTMYPTEEQMIRSLDEVGTVMMAQSGEVCPADKKLYSLRDVTATVESIPLITASIVSKKWAEGVDAIVYDVKSGPAAFMSSLEQASHLASSLVNTSELTGMASSACITRMDEPLGSMIGNAMEVQESLWILSNEYPSDLHKRLCVNLRDLCVELTVEMAMLAGTRNDRSACIKEAHTCLENGKALAVFEKMAKQQGAVDGWREKLSVAPEQLEIYAEEDGTVTSIDSRAIGVLGLDLKVGRKKTEDDVDPAVGFEMLCAPGDSVSKGQALLKLHCQSKANYDKYASQLASFIKIESSTGQATSPSSLFLEKISPDNSGENND